MKFWTGFKETCRRFIRDRPGERFRNLHERMRARRRGILFAIIEIALGILLIAGGLFLGLVPGIPGIVLAILGLALIVAQFAAPARWCDVAEMAVREFIIKCRGSRRY